VVRRLSGRGGEAVIRLETPFGGGKTHALLALYHLLRSHEQVLGLDTARQLLGDIPPEEVPAARVAVFVGAEADALAGRTPWGELATQLGAYDLVREHDRQRVSPGKAVLRQVLESPGEPVLLLVDELAQYLVRTTGMPSTAPIATCLSPIRMSWKPCWQSSSRSLTPRSSAMTTWCWVRWNARPGAKG
jgi:hypothetical protein